MGHNPLKIENMTKTNMQACRNFKHSNTPSFQFYLHQAINISQFHPRDKKAVCFHAPV